MSSIARRIRATLAMALFWSASWAIIGLLLGLSAWLRRPFGSTTSFSPITWVLVSAVPFAVLGALCGAGFAMLLSRAERDQTVDDLGRRRTALWGAVASGACFVAYLGLRGSLLVMMSHPGPLVANLGIFALLGGLSSFGSLAIARRASLPGQSDQREIAAT